MAAFDTYVGSILNYGAEIWGFHKAPLHFYFLKSLLRVKQSTNHDILLYELGRYTLSTIRKIKIFKYYIKLITTDNELLQCFLTDMINNNDNWILNIKRELDTMGLSYLWSNVNKSSLYIFKQRIFDIFQQSCFNKFVSLLKLYITKTLFLILHYRIIF